MTLIPAFTHNCIAIDPGEVNSGFALLSTKDSLISLQGSFLKVLPDRLKKMGHFAKAEYFLKLFQELLDCHRPDLVAIEGPALMGYRMFSIGMLHGFLLSECIRRKISFIHIPISTWKYVLTGKGNSQPNFYRQCVCQSFNKSKTDISLDEAAAIGLGYISLRFFLYQQKWIDLSDLSAYEAMTYFSRPKSPLLNSEDIFWHFYE